MCLIVVQIVSQNLKKKKAFVYAKYIFSIPFLGVNATWMHFCETHPHWKCLNSIILITCNAHGKNVLE